MNARNKLNVAHLNGRALVAAVVGAATGSWPLFLLTFVALVAAAVVNGDIRTHPRRR